MVTVEYLAKEVEKIKGRNRKVELDKRWETSLFRRLLLGFFTYFSMGLYMYTNDILLGASPRGILDLSFLPPIGVEGRLRRESRLKSPYLFLKM